jgi:hypothetical protein
MSTDDAEIAKWDPGRTRCTMAQDVCRERLASGLQFISLFLESEVAGVQHMSVSSGYVALISHRTRDRE